MMDFLQEWIIRIVGAAFLMAAASVLTPRGAVKRIELLCCAVILLLAVLQPLLGNDLPELPEAQRIEESIRQQREEFQKSGRAEWEALIEEELVSYIESKAKELGVDCSVSVRLAEGENGIPFPDAVELTAEERHEGLQRYIEQELGVAAERIRWRTA